MLHGWYSVPAEPPGPYYAIGGALKGVLEASDMIQSLTVESTGASVMNINNIDQGLNQVALVMSDVARLR